MRKVNRSLEWRKVQLLGEITLFPVPRKLGAQNEEKWERMDKYKDQVKDRGMM